MPQQKNLQQQQKLIREELAAAYQILALQGKDDLTYTHLSARLPGADYFFIYPFGLLFEEVNASCLLKVSLDGQILEGQECQYNQTGYVIHGSIYRNRSDINAIFHLHTSAGVAVSSLECGLLPINQWALHFYNRIAYHGYNSLALTADRHEQNLLKDLGLHKVMIMRNHGTLTTGATLQEALFYTHHLEKACEAQLMALQSSQAIIRPSIEICEKTVVDLLSFEKELGHRDWEAWIRKLGRHQINYKD